MFTRHLLLSTCLQLYPVDRRYYEDTRLQMLEKIGQSGGRNPIQETEYQTLKSQFAATDPATIAQKQLADQQKALTDQAAANKLATDARFDANKAELGNFVNKYQTEVPGIINDTSNKYQLGTLLGQTNALNTRVKDLSGNLTNSATGYANAGQVDKAINSNYLPRYQTAVQNLQTGTQLAQNEENTLLQPYQVEGSLLNDRLAREATGYSQDQQNQLDVLIQNMNAGISLTTAQMQQATELARLEQQKEQYESDLSYKKQQDSQAQADVSKDYIDVGNGTLYNVRTGQFIRSPYATGTTGKLNNPAGI